MMLFLISHKVTKRQKKQKKAKEKCFEQSIDIKFVVLIVDKTINRSPLLI